MTTVSNKAKDERDPASQQRPWGRFETLGRGVGYHVKRIIVSPGGILSLQSHKYRAEHWIIVQGIARITIGDSVSNAIKDGTVYIPLGAVHRLENAGTTELILIEVQTGSYFGEDDIVRYEDIYNRL